MINIVILVPIKKKTKNHMAVFGGYTYKSANQYPQNVRYIERNLLYVIRFGIKNKTNAADSRPNSIAKTLLIILS